MFLNKQTIIVFIFSSIYHLAYLLIPLYHVMSVNGYTRISNIIVRKSNSRFKNNLNHLYMSSINSSDEGPKDPLLLILHELKILNEWKDNYSQNDKKWKDDFSQNDTKWKDDFSQNDKKWKDDFSKNDKKWKNEFQQWRNGIDLIVKENKPYWVKGGKTYEVITRDRRKYFRGDDYAKPFKVTNLYGLARISAPKDKYYSTIEKNVKKIDVADSAIYHYNRTTELAIVALSQIPKLRNWYNISHSLLKANLLKSTKEVTKYHSLENSLSKFDKIVNDSDKLIFLSQDSLGLYCLTSLILTNSSKKGFIREVEFDIKGSVEIFRDFVIIRTDEIKTGHDYKKAIAQLIIRLNLLELVCGHFFPKDVFQFRLEGNIISVVNGWTSPSLKDINEIAKSIGVNMTTSDIEINIIEADN